MYGDVFVQLRPVAFQYFKAPWMFRCIKLFWKSIDSSISWGDGKYFNKTVTQNTDQRQQWAFYWERKSYWWNGHPSHPSLTLLRCCRPYWRIPWLLVNKISLKHLSEICKEEWAKIIPENCKKKKVNDYQNHIETVVATNGRYTKYKTPINLLFFFFIFYAAMLLVSNCMNTFVIAIIYKNISLKAITCCTSVIT